MTCPTHVPVVTEGPEGDYMRTDCRACGMSLPREEAKDVEAELTPAQKAAITRAANRQAADEAAKLAAYNSMTNQEIADFAFESGILEAPLDVSDTVGVRLEGNKLILTFTDGEITLPADADPQADMQAATGGPDFTAAE